MEELELNAHSVGRGDTVYFKSYEAYNEQYRCSTARIRKPNSGRLGSPDSNYDNTLETYNRYIRNKPFRVDWYGVSDITFKNSNYWRYEAFTKRSPHSTKAKLNKLLKGKT